MMRSDPIDKILLIPIVRFINNSTTGGILYLGCICLMLLAGQERSIWLFNSILHGLDVSTVSRMNAPPGQIIASIVLTFGLIWIAGFLTGTIYNWKKN